MKMHFIVLTVSPQIDKNNFHSILRVATIMQLFFVRVVGGNGSMPENSNEDIIRK
jgi:hypothetical protein